MPTLPGRVRRRLYREGRAGAAAKILNAAQGRLAGLGLGPRRLVAVEVAGRRTGRTISFPAVVADYDRERYLVSMLGERANWVRNVRAAEGRAVLRHGRREPVLLDEVAVEQRAPILKRYVQLAPGARAHIPVGVSGTVEAFAAIAQDYPVFRIRPGAPPTGRPADCARAVRRASASIVLLASAVLAAACSGSPRIAGSGAATASSSGPAPTAQSASSAQSAPATTSTGSPGSSSTGPAPASASAAARRAPPVPIRTATVHAADGRTYVIDIWWVVRNASCAAHAHGVPVVSFLARHPCRGLQRILATTRVRGRLVGFNQSSTGFSGPSQDPYRYARQFRTLELQDGTGSIDDLLREGYRLPSGPSSLPSPDAFNALQQDAGVSVWDVWYLDGPTPANDPALITMTEDIYLQY